MKWLSLFQCLSYRFTVYRTAFTDECDDTLMCDSNRKDTAAAAKSLQSCPTLCDPIDGSPPGSPCPWDSPGKNTGVGCHFLLQCMKVKSESKVAQSCPTLSDPMDCSPPGSSVHGIFRQEYWSGVPLPSPRKDTIKLILWYRPRNSSQSFWLKNVLCYSGITTFLILFVYAEKQQGDVVWKLSVYKSLQRKQRTPTVPT